MTPMRHYFSERGFEAQVDDAYVARISLDGAETTGVSVIHTRSQDTSVARLFSLLIQGRLAEGITARIISEQATGIAVESVRVSEGVVKDLGRRTAPLTLGCTSACLDQCIESSLPEYYYCIDVCMNSCVGSPLFCYPECEDMCWEQMMLSCCAQCGCQQCPV